ncbi:MAG: putative Xaa-Pro aminopeptidase [Candidatus Saccharibacteria bacterium]|nr:putative Xaa-Pro aminopeptidase [Candidatus Saccharibacteria bacterium]
MKSPDSSYFIHNREKVMKKLQGGLLVVAGYTGMQLTNDDSVPFVQEATFWYLCGVDFPDWWLIIDAKRQKTWLVEPDIDERLKIFSESLSKETALATSGVDEVISRDDAMSLLRRTAKDHPLVYTVEHPDYHEHFGFTLNPAIKEMKDMLSRTFSTVRNFRLEIAKIRAIKEKNELEWMQAAIDLTIDAFKLVKEKLPTYKYDYQIQADITHLFLNAGAEGHAFDPIIATGEGTATVHYFSKKNHIKKGTPLLMDIGVRLNGFTSDLTRTYAIGKPSRRLGQIHSAVLKAEQQCINLLRPGLSVEEYYQSTEKIMKAALVELKLMEEGDNEKYRLLFPHSISHGLGIDVHEALGRPHYFEPGMVLMVEPGIYLQDEKFGVRLEDVILITDTGHKNLSAKLSTSL